MSNDPHSAILAALYHGNRPEADRLADAAADLTVFEAAALGRHERLQAALEANPGAIHGFAPDGHTALGLAAFFAGAPTVRLLLDRGADPHASARNAMLVQPLHAAVASRNAEAVMLLLERGANPNARQQIGYTPLMGAASAGREDLVDLLIRYRADPAAVSEDGKTAAQVAREHGHADLAARLESLVG